jgi:hypothetical protein
MSDKSHVHGGRESSGSIVPAKRSNEGQGGPQEIVEGRLLAKENVKPPIPAPDTVPDVWANAWLVGVRQEACASQRLIQGGNRVRYVASGIMWRPAIKAH